MMKSLYLFFSVWVLCLFTAKADAYSGVAGFQNLPSHKSGFEENKGQIRNTKGAVAQQVNFRLLKNNAQIFLLKNGIAYQFGRSLKDGESHGDEERWAESSSFETYRMDMVLEGASADVEVTAEEVLPGHIHDYRCNALFIRSFEKVTYHGVYPGIDWVVYATDQGITYDFIVHPGGDPHDIRLRFSHHEELFLEADGSLVHGNRLGRFTEQAPKSFQSGREVATTFVLEGSLLRFSVNDYDHNEILTIDPPRIWGSYYGSAQIDSGEDCATDSEGNIYLAGTTFSVDAIADGGHQITLAGESDAFLVKFTPAGVRLWATYYGGSASDQGKSCAVDGDGNIYLAGNTESTEGIASEGHLNTYPEGSSGNAFLAKFDGNGTRIWATYYGDSGSETGNACSVDDEGNVYLAGNTNSASGIADGGFQNTFGGNISGDGYLVKFQPDGTRIWGSYFGGAGSDVALSVFAGSNGNIALGGNTSSNEGLASVNAHQDEEAGFGDGFVALFNADGERLWSTYYGGGSNDFIQGISIDAEGNVFAAGTTLSPSGIAANGHDNTGGGMTTDAFLVKFNGSGVRQWATYYGDSGLEQGRACANDSEGNVYLAGQTGSANGIAINGHQNSYGGGASIFAYDAFLVKFDTDGERIWGTYYGSTGVEDGRACAITPDNDVVLVGTTNSANAIAENGHLNALSGETDAFITKLYGSDPLGAEDQDGNKYFNLYPNPNKGGQWFLDLSTLSVGASALLVEVFDLSGKQVALIPIQKEDVNSAHIPIHLSLTPGMYLFKVRQNDRSYVVKAVVL